MSSITSHLYGDLSRVLTYCHIVHLAVTAASSIRFEDNAKTDFKCTISCAFITDIMVPSNPYLLR